MEALAAEIKKEIFEWLAKAPRIATNPNVTLQALMVSALESKSSMVF
jgi:hypothetical protein